MTLEKYDPTIKPDPPSQWVSVEVEEKPMFKNSSLIINIEGSTIEVKSRFDPILLKDVVKHTEVSMLNEQDIERVYLARGKVFLPIPPNRGSTSVAVTRCNRMDEISNRLNVSVFNVKTLFYPHVFLISRGFLTRYGFKTRDINGNLSFIFNWNVPYVFTCV